MNFLRGIFRKKDKPKRSYEDFWLWFVANEKRFYDAVKKGENIEKTFFNRLIPKLLEIREGFFFLTGMVNDNVAELVLTADGTVKNFVFVRELVSAAPDLPNWTFTYLKPAINIENLCINMAGYTFDKDNLFFYSEDLPEYPDEIDITIVYRNFKESDRSTIVNGIYVFIDNFLGELHSSTTIDNLYIKGNIGSMNELIPIEKLKDFLIWRQKEFIEKYEGVRYETEKDSYSSFEGVLENGNPILATINSTLLEWDRKASHPWILKVLLKYDGEKTNGMPNDMYYSFFNNLEEQIMEELQDFEGYLNIGREIGDNEALTFFACKEFMKASEIVSGLISNHIDFNLSYDIYKDKYWQSFNRFK